MTPSIEQLERRDCPVPLPPHHHRTIAMESLVIVDQQTAVPTADVQAVAAALQVQMDRDFAPAWGIQVNVRVVEDPAQVGASDWPIYLFNDVNGVPDALAWHTTENGVPAGIVPVLRAIQYGVSWSEDLSHEALEMAVDPQCNRAVYTPSFRGQPAWVSLEIADPVENDGYAVDGWQMSNFVTRSWFSAAGRGSYDHLKKLRYPLTMTPGGYVSFFSVRDGTWEDVFGRLRPAEQRDVQPFSRRWRRQQARGA